MDIEQVNPHGELRTLIVTTLSSGPLSVKALASKVNSNDPLVSRVLAKLKTSGIVLRVGSRWSLPAVEKDKKDIRCVLCNVKGRMYLLGGCQYCALCRRKFDMPRRKLLTKVVSPKRK